MGERFQLQQQQAADEKEAQARAQNSDRRKPFVAPRELDSPLTNIHVNQVETVVVQDSGVTAAEVGDRSTLPHKRGVIVRPNMYMYDVGVSIRVQQVAD